MKSLALSLLALLILGLQTSSAQFGLPSVPGIPGIPKIPGTGGGAGSTPSVPDVIKGGQNLVKGLSGINQKEEQDIGQQTALQIISQYGGLDQDGAANKRVVLIGRSLAMYCDRTGLPWTFGILNSSTVNAFSAPGGYVFITRGLYGKVQNDAQLAAVLGHEISHITRRHALRAVSRNQALQGFFTLAAQGGAAAGGPDLTAYDQGIGAVSNTILKGGYDPAAEYDADKSGRALAIATGYDKDGLLQFLSNLLAVNAPKAQTFSTHPPLADRVNKLKAAK